MGGWVSGQGWAGAWLHALAPQALGLLLTPACLHLPPSLPAKLPGSARPPTQLRPYAHPTGPNTGGKTASLKALGLAAVAARCGLPVPAAAPAKLPCFDAVLADIGESLDACQTGFADLFSCSGWLKLVSLLEVFSRVHSSASVHSINSRAAAVGNRLHCMTRHHGLLPPPI